MTMVDNMESPMEILWLSHFVPYPPKGGSLQRSYNLLREIAKRHNVFLLAFVQEDLLRLVFPDIGAGRSEAMRELKRLCKDVRFVDIPCEKKMYGKYQLAFKSIFTSTPYTVNWLRHKVMEKEILSVRAHRNFDIVHFDTISLAPYADLLDEESAVLNHHNIESHMMLRRAENERSWFKKWYFYQEGRKLRRFEQIHCGKFGANFTCSILDSRRLKALDATLRIEEVPNGVDVEYFKPRGEPILPMRLVFAGGLNWYPNREAMRYFAREVWPLTKQKVPGVSIDVIGATPPEDLLALSRSDETFRVHGYVDDVRPYLNQAAIYVCPIRDGGGTKLKLLDAFAMAKPTVAHPVACEGIDVVDGRDVLLASTPEEFASRIGFLCENDTVRQSMGENARRLVVEQYAYSTIGSKLSSIYLSLSQKNASEKSKAACESGEKKEQCA